MLILSIFQMFEKKKAECSMSNGLIMEYYKRRERNVNLELKEFNMEEKLR